MAMIGRLHPLLVHFPIGLILVAAASEAVAIATDRRAWRHAAVVNARAGAVLGIGAAVAGWRLAASGAIDPSSWLEWHRWLGTLAGVAMVGSALATVVADRRSPYGRWVYRATLFCAAALVAIAGHFGGLLVWGVELLRP
jgi:uncharacterized membrane protein